jgi:inner membrane protein
MEQRPSFYERYTAIIKMLTIGVLVLLLLIPSFLVRDLIREREQSQDEVKREISSKWGQAQTVVGPIISIPYEDYINNKRDKIIRYVHLLPEELNIEGDLDTSTLHRSIYEVISYATDLSISGKFNAEELAKNKISVERLMFNKATLTLGITDLTGVMDAIKVKWQNSSYDFNPGLTCKDNFYSGVSVSVPFSSTSKVDFALNLSLKGSDYLHFIPVGKETNVKLGSKCPNPSFEGDFLPTNRTVDTDGFSADWKVLHLNRNFPQTYTGEDQNINKSWFGVSLMLDVDHYQKSMRSAKYAVLFIAMTFLTFFFIEVINKKRIHPIQYILIGLVLVLFYVLLLSFSEQIGFGPAYFISSLAVVLLVTVYTRSALQSSMNSVIMFTVLTVLYAFIYIIIQLAEYSLLFGSIGLFLFLASVMLASRKVDWYNLGVQKNED